MSIPTPIASRRSVVVGEIIGRSGLLRVIIGNGATCGYRSALLLTAATFLPITVVSASRVISLKPNLSISQYLAGLISALLILVLAILMMAYSGDIAIRPGNINWRYGIVEAARNNLFIFHVFVYGMSWLISTMTMLLARSAEGIIKTIYP